MLIWSEHQSKLKTRHNLGHRDFAHTSYYYFLEKNKASLVLDSSYQLQIMHCDCSFLANLNRMS
jgi:hypothetical protein